MEKNEHGDDDDVLEISQAEAGEVAGLLGEL